MQTARPFTALVLALALGGQHFAVGYHLPLPSARQRRRALDRPVRHAPGEYQRWTAIVGAVTPALASSRSACVKP